MAFPQVVALLITKLPEVWVRLRDLEMGIYYQARHQGRKINNDRDIG